MNKHLKLLSALLVLMVLASISVVVFPADAEAAQALVENSWRYEDGQLVAEEATSEEDGIALLSMDALPDGATAQGIDVSEHQGRIDWDAVKASGIDFAILRVGFGAPSFRGRVDYQFNRNISECERLGIPYGVYLYSYAWDDRQAAEEASMVIDCLSGHNPRLPVYYDLEDNSIIANGRQSGIASRAQVFCNRISAAGYKPGIYANLNWFNNILTDSVFKSGSWDHWIAQYNWRCDYTGKYSFWQYASNGRVPGINGNVDVNYAYVDVSLYFWQLKDGTWYYATADGKAYTGWLRLGGSWYWLDPDAGGAMATGLHECNGSTYWFDASGAMATGWVLDGGTWCYATGSGALASGWLSLNGAWYWLDPSTHAMATGLHECNGSLYWFNSSGAMATGWALDGGTWYYATGSGALARGPVSVGGVLYCFDARTGAMLTGYQTDAHGVRRYFGSCGPLNGWGLVDGSWYWFADGIASTGWLYTGGSWYWLDPEAGGAMATGLHACNGSAYWFNSSGAMATGWVLDGGTWCYATGSGALASGWLNLNGTWYWLDPSTHAMATGFHECNGSLYWFNASGAMATGWLLDGGTWYYATGSGALARGPVSVGGVPYCFDARTGAMLTGYQTDAQGVRRYFGSCGPLNGWGLVDGSWYWFANGIASTGWLYTGGSWYWLDPDAGGAMVTGLHVCNGSAYWFSASGAMATGWVLDGGTWYYATGSGALASGWLSLSGAWYWLDPSTHAMTTGVQTIGSCEYIFNSTGKMMANCWSNGDGSWMYHSSSSGAIDLKGIMTDSGIQLIDDDGNARTGWIESQGSRYYCSANGVILTGWQQIAGSWYYFNSDGRMATGWLNDGGNWYWLDSASGIMKTGWLSRGDTWYYLDAARGGVMLSNGWYWIGSTDYKFSSSGAMVGAWVDVPCYSQYPELPTGCESVALTNLLNYYGFGLGKTIIADYYLPKGSNGNFVTAFDGNPRRSSGGLMGCVAPAITIAGNNFLRAAGSGKQAKDVSFSSISSIKNRLTCGQPVEMWNTEWGSWPGGRYAARWYNGHSYGLWGGNHAVVLKGYDDEQGIVYLSDSINGNVTRNAQVFFGTWQQMDSQAVVIE